MSRIGPTAKFFMIAAAVIIDLTGLAAAIIALIPGAQEVAVVGTVADIIASIGFGICFSHYGVSVITKRPGAFFGTILGEGIPWFGAIPFWTIFVATTIAQERAGSEV